MFSADTELMWTAVVKFPEHGVTMGLSHRESDPDGMWCADWRIESNGMVNFSHGDGDRSCAKQFVTEGPLHAAITDAVRAMTIGDSHFDGCDACASAGRTYDPNRHDSQNCWANS